MLWLVGEWHKQNVLIGWWMKKQNVLIGWSINKQNVLIGWWMNKQNLLIGWSYALCSGYLCPEKGLHLP